MRVLRAPAVLLALSCVLIAAAVLPTALCCQAAAHASQGTDAHDCCKGKEHGAACPRSKAPPPTEPGCPTMRDCDTADGLLMRLLAQVGFIPGHPDITDEQLALSENVIDRRDSPVAHAPNPDPPPPRV